VAQRYPTSEPKGPLNTRFRPAVDPVAPTLTSYDILDRTTRLTLPDGTASTMAYGFGPDRSGTGQFETAVTDANGNTKRSYFDVRRLTTSVKETNPAGGQPTIWTSYGYDPLGELTKVVDDRQSTTTASYDNFGRRTSIDSPDLGRTQLVFDLAGNTTKEVTAVLGAEHEAVQYDYSFNRLAAIRYPVFDDNDVRYTYGAPGAPAGGADRVVKVEDAAGTVTREYGPLGEVTKETRRMSGTLDGREFTTRYRYDTWNRVQQMTYPDGEVLSYHYNSGGLVDGATGVKGTNTYQYLRRLDYDKFDQRVTLEAGNGTKTRYTYDAADRRLATLSGTLPGGQEFEHKQYGYDSVGNVTSIENSTLASAALGMGGPVTQSFSYDNLNRLTASTGEYRPANGSTDRYRLDMAYDSVNNVTLKNQNHEIVPPTNPLLSASNDAAANDGATVDFTATGAAAAVQPDSTYRYPYTYQSGKPHAPSTIGPFELRYDANGNLVSRKDTGPGGRRRQMVWDEENRLACSQDGKASDPTIEQEPESCDRSAVNVRFVYDDQGQRVVKNGGSKNLNLYPSPSYSQRNNSAFKHIFVGGTRLVTKLVEPDRFVEANQFYFHPDQLGSTGYGTDQQGKLVEHEQYLPSGETWVDEHSTDPNPYRFSGKELDAETGLYYYGARYYDPRTTLWQSPDPAVGTYVSGAGSEGVFNPANLAAYTYTYNNPVRLTDPDGRQTITSDRLAEIGRNNIIIGLPPFTTNRQAMGHYFEDAAIRSLGWEPRNNRRFTPESTGPWIRSDYVIPEAVRDLRIFINGVPTNRALSDGLFLEVKAQSRDVTLGQRGGQMRSYVDILARAYQDARVVDPNTPTPWLMYVTTGDAGISPSAAAYADSKGVALWRATMFELPGGDPNNPLVMLGPFLPANVTAWRVLIDAALARPPVEVQLPTSRPVRLIDRPYVLVQPTDPAQE
jgi:RHS repeat-associated protein